eukprot:146514-Rhodomonas_salina.1
MQEQTTTSKLSNKLRARHGFVVISLRAFLAVAGNSAKLAGDYPLCLGALVDLNLSRYSRARLQYKTVVPETLGSYALSSDGFRPINQTSDPP